MIFYFIVKINQNIEKFLSIQESKTSLPNFKEKMNSEDNLKIEKTMSLIGEMMPKLSDDDYFLDKSDSVIYTYLMSEDVLI